MAFELAFYIAGCDIEAGDLLVLDPLTGQVAPYVSPSVVGYANRDYPKGEQVLIRLPVVQPTKAN